MEKSITYTLKQKEYIKYLISRVCNYKVFLLYLALTLALKIRLIKEDFSPSKLASYFIISVLEALGLTLITLVLMMLYGTYLYKKDKNMQMKVTMNFHEDHLEEVTETTSFSLKYTEIKNLKLFKNILVISISPARAFIIPESTDYDIKELHSELLKLNKNKEI